MKLLHIDQDVDFAHQLRRDLLRNGAVLCDLEQVATVDEAVERLCDMTYDAIVIDPFSSTSASVAACQTIHMLAPETPMLCLTETDDVSTALDAVAMGAHDFLVKEESRANWTMRRIRYAIERYRMAQRRDAVPVPRGMSRRHANVAAVRSPAAAIHSPGGLFVPDEQEFDASESDESLVRKTRPSKLRVLHIEDEMTVYRLTSRFLTRKSPFEFRIDHASDFASGMRMAEDNLYDAVILDLTLPDRQGPTTLRDLLSVVGNTPILVMTGRDEDDIAIDLMREGAEDYLIKGDVNLKYMAMGVPLAVARRAKWAASLPVAAEVAPQPALEEVEIENPPAAEVQNRRAYSRYMLTKTVFVIPILPDGSPAETSAADGLTIDISEGGIRFTLPQLDRLPTKYMLLGIEGNDGVLYFATVEARRISPGEGGLSVGGSFATDAHDLLRQANLEPQLDPVSRRFETGLPTSVLTKWGEMGIFRPVLCDRVLGCPRCQCVATFRNGCRVCGSVRLHSRPLIHHFACAHVDFVTSFEVDGTMICPKCRTRNMIVGADFEHLNGPFRCMDCDWSDTELELVGQCLKCQSRFPVNQAVEEDLIGFHVNRLDPLAFLDAT